MIEYEIFVQILFFLPVFYRINKGKSLDISHIACFLFAAYVITVFFITNVGTLADGLKNGIVIDVVKFNSHPFSRHIYYPGYLANFIMFIPFGFLASVIERKDIGIIRAFLEGLSFSLLIEASQLLNSRYTDVDDLIINTAGAIAGYILFKIFVNKRYSKNGNNTFEASKYVLAMFFGHFLLYNESIYNMLLG